ncbi:MAG: hemolysin family protein [Jatrophihabitantaceae bacterium]
MTGLLLVAALVLLLGNAFFVAAEFAAVSVRRAQIQPLAATSRRARHVLAAQQRLSLLLAGAQLGITLCSLGLGAVAEPAVAAIFEDLFHALGVPTGLNHPLAFTIALAVVVLSHMVIGEMVPKNIALATSERAALLLVPTLDGFVTATGPVIRGLNALANAGLRLARIEPQDELKSAYTPDELAEILAESRNEGYLDAAEHHRLSSALQLAERTAADATIPHAALVTISTATTTAELEALTAATGYSRFPVQDPSRPGALLGFVHIKDVLTGAHDPARPWPAQHLHRMPVIPADSPLPDVITALRRARSHLGHVTDGATSLGVLALEDVVEEFVGEISDASHTGP